MPAEIRVDPLTGEAVRFQDGLPYHRPDTLRRKLTRVALFLGFAALFPGTIGLFIHFHREDLLNRYFPYVANAFVVFGLVGGCWLAYVLVKAKQWGAIVSFSVALLAIWLFRLFPEVAIDCLAALASLALLIFVIFALSKWWRIILPVLACYVVLHFIVKYW